MKKLLLPLLAIVAFSCTKEDPKIIADKKELVLNIPESDIDEAVVGRVLFYDTRLSENNSISCASCHKQNLGFADNSAFSTGFQGHQTKRNSIAIDRNTGGFVFCGGPALETPLFWDGRESNLNNMVILPALNHVEMGMSDQAALVERVRSAGYYRDLFSKLNSTQEININSISNCLQAFVQSIQNVNSKFDLVSNGAAHFTSLESNGMDLFFNVYPCGSCHHPSSPYSNSTTLFMNIGLDENPADAGRAGVTTLTSDIGKFRVPSLKNVALSGPYMHDGRFNTLDDVLEHYSHGIKNDPNLDPLLKEANGTPKQFNFTPEQKKALIAFLNTMTDFNIVSAENLSDPFKQ